MVNSSVMVSAMICNSAADLRTLKHEDLPVHSQPTKNRQSFPSPHPERDHVAHLNLTEFSCLCLLIGQQDFPLFLLGFTPDQGCLELKHHKLYLWSFCAEGVFYAAMTNRIADELIASHYLHRFGHWHVRGGITMDVLINHRQEDWRISDLPNQLPPLHRANQHKFEY
ncbi:NADPH-dependent 7-cyano-7-deazaguanine reductase QueF [Acidithiobacillus ferrooxidans]|jgi:7-cyano-7-deazaguanine reductase|nr:NADPH-dependent 7-cyano-7-deazaguanine reductase QueF [Acidithiobacillus ferrooxidans]MCR1356351.1 NADPH-dependent 7-cyano-7-deazaguanine reductase QueF [Acidithiobacillus ferrooxidans]